MPGLHNGLFDGFDNLDQIDVENVLRWLNPVPRRVALEDYIANRILYPGALPVSLSDVKIDLAILREALRLNSPYTKQGPAVSKSEFLGAGPFINLTMRKIIIPEGFLDFVPDIGSLVCAFVDGLLMDRFKKDWFQDLWTVVLSGENDDICGSVILPQFANLNSSMEIKVEDKNYKIKPGNVSILPCPKKRCSIDFTLKEGKILGKNKSAIEVYGGKLGLLVDGRLQFTGDYY